MTRSPGWYGAVHSSPTGALDRYESLAAWFHRCHRMLAPGKDAPAGFGAAPDDAVDRWYAFCSALGPSDVACVMTVELRKAERATGARS